MRVNVVCPADFHLCPQCSSLGKARRRGDPSLGSDDRILMGLAVEPEVEHFLFTDLGVFQVDLGNDELVVHRLGLGEDVSFGMYDAYGRSV